MVNIYFTSGYVDMLVHGCGVSRYPWFYDQYLEKCQLLPRTYLGIFEDDNGEKMTKEKWILDLAGEADHFLWEFIEKMTTSKYWQNMETFLIAAK